MIWVGSKIGPGNRLCPVGRLDENSTGLVCLTSNGLLPNAVQCMRRGCEEYTVSTDKEVKDHYLQQLRESVEITTAFGDDRASSARGISSEGRGG